MENNKYVYVSVYITNYVYACVGKDLWKNDSLNACISCSPWARPSRDFLQLYICKLDGKTLVAAGFQIMEHKLEDNNFV